MPHEWAASKGTLKKRLYHLHWKVLKSHLRWETHTLLKHVCYAREWTTFWVVPKSQVTWPWRSYKSCWSSCFRAAGRIGSIPQLCSKVLLSLLMCPCRLPTWWPLKSILSHLLHRDFSELIKVFQQIWVLRGVGFVLFLGGIVGKKWEVFVLWLC